MAYRVGSGNNNGTLTFDAGYESITFTITGFGSKVSAFNITNGTIGGDNSYNPGTGNASGTLNAGFSTNYDGSEVTIIVTDPTEQVVITGKRYVLWGFTAIESTPDNRTDASLAWKKSGNVANSDTASLETGDDTMPTIALDNSAHSHPVTYSSSNTGVATIVESGVGAGTITLVAAGETTISAIFAGDEDYKPLTVSYTLTVSDNRTVVATPTFSPAAGAVAANTQVSISCATEGATIYYTVDGSDPTTESATYSSAITIDAAKTIKAIAVKANYKPSAIATAAYTITINTSTAENPYTASEAITLASEHSSETISDVYVKGIVCQTGSIATSGDYAGSVSYYVSDDGTTTNKFEMYRGKYISGAAFTDETNLKLGDLVVAKGVLKYYTNNSQAELDTGNEVISVFRAPAFSIEGGVYEGAQTVSLTAENGATIYYTLDGSAPTSSSSTYSAPLSISETTTVKAIAIKDGVSSGVAIAIYTIDSNANDGSQAKPFTVAEAIAAYDANNAIGSKYVKGIISTAGSISNSKLNCYISDDGTTATQFELYNITSGATVDNLVVGSAVLAHGTFTKYQSTYEISGTTVDAILVKPTISGDENFVTSVTVTLSCASGATIYYTNDGTEPTTSSSVYSASLNLTATTTIKAIAEKDGLVTGVATKTFNKVQAYAVTWSAPSNGSITVKHGETTLSSGATIPAGETITITTSPSTGYTLSSLVYNDGTEHDIKSTKLFTMPSHAVTIAASFTSASNSPIGFPVEFTGSNYSSGVTTAAGTATITCSKNIQAGINAQNMASANNDYWLFTIPVQNVQTTHTITIAFTDIRNNKAASAGTYTFYWSYNNSDYTQFDTYNEGTTKNTSESFDFTPTSACANGTLYIKMVMTSGGATNAGNHYLGNVTISIN